MELKKIGRVILLVSIFLLMMFTSAFSQTPKFEWLKSEPARDKKANSEERGEREIVNGFYRDENDKLYHVHPVFGDRSVEGCYKEIDLLKEMQLRYHMDSSYSHTLLDPLHKLASIANAASAFEEDSLIQLLIDFPAYTRSAQALKMKALLEVDDKYSDMKGMRRTVLEGLLSENQNAKYYAALKLATWNEWELAAPVLSQAKDIRAWHYLRGNNRAARFFAELALDTSKSGHVRNGAACAASSISGDQSILKKTAEDLLKNADPNTTDMDEIRGYWSAAQYLSRDVDADTEIINNLTKLVFGNNWYLADQALTSLGILALKGNDAATEALYHILEEHPDIKIRSQAAVLIP